MVHRGIATLAGALMLLFLYLGNLEPQYFLLHLYQSLIYLAIILMLFYFEDRYAYMLGIIAPAFWLLMTYAVGLLGGATRQFAHLLHAQRPSNQVSLLAGVTAVLSVVMIIVCAYRWMQEFAGLGRGLITFFVSLGIVVVYYAILVVWFWHIVPQTSPSG